KSTRRSEWTGRDTGKILRTAHRRVVDVHAAAYGNRRPAHYCNGIARIRPARAVRSHSADPRTSSRREQSGDTAPRGDALGHTRAEIEARSTGECDADAPDPL